MAISGGQNEPRDVLSGSVYALLKDPEQLDLVLSEDASWNDVFDEYVRWISPIQIHVRKVIAHFELYGTAMKPDDMLVFMLASGHRDASVYEDPNTFKLLRRGPKNFAFGAGAHFCAGAHSARALIANVALPMIFERFKNLRLAGDVPFGGWVFRGALSMPIAWDT